MDLQALREHRFEPKRIAYGSRDTILYALSVGVGSDPLDANQLRLAYEKGLEALPTMAAVLAHPGAWIAEPRFKVNFLKLLHGEQGLTVHRPLPAEGQIEASYRVRAVVDKGEGKGALVYFEKDLRIRARVSRFAPYRRHCSCVPTAAAAASAQPPEPLPPTAAGHARVLGRDQDFRRSRASVPAQR